MRDLRGKTCHVLLVNPRFNGASFWDYRETCRLIGARCPDPSLGLITVAALLPQSWDLRLLDRNVSEDEATFETLLDWADLVMAGGMLVQQNDLFAVIDRVQARGLPVAVGGPDVSSSPQLYERADFRIIGEAEGCIDAFIAAWQRGERQGTFRTPLFSVDVTKTPIPRFELLDFSSYSEITVQFSRGCPFLCEFCDIIELYGRKPRTKTNEQMLAELQRLYALGYRGIVQFADDNLIGNKKAVKAFLPELIAWQRARRYPFEFVTEASLNLADDAELLALLRDANFFGIFIGIESPDPDVLVAAQKKQNTRRDIVENIHNIQAAGIVVVAGFIVGFDNEKSGTDRAMIDLIEAAPIPVAMVGLLSALANTQLATRLEKEGRLHPGYNVWTGDDRRTDQCTGGLNFDTLRPRAEILGEYRNVVDGIYGVDAYFGRMRRLIDLLDCSGVNGSLHRPALRTGLIRLIRLLWNVTVRPSPMRAPLWRLIAYILRRNPRALKAGLYTAAFYAHIGPFSRVVVAEIDRQIAEAKAAVAAAPRASGTAARLGALPATAARASAAV